MATAAEIVLIKISELSEMLTTEFNDSYIPLSSGLDSFRLELEQLRRDILDNSTLTGVASAPTPPPGTNTRQLATAEFVQDSLAGLGLNPATSTDYGTVRTNSTDSVPIVYLKQEIDALLATINSINSSQASDLTSLDSRLGAYDALTVGSRLTSAESRLNGAETLNTSQNSQIAGIQTLNTTQNTRLTNLEAISAGGRLNSLEALSIGARLQAIESLQGFAQGVWLNMTAAGGNNQGFSGGGSGNPSFTLPGWSAPNFGGATYFSIPVGGTYEITYNASLGSYSGTAPTQVYLDLCKAPASNTSAYVVIDRAGGANGTVTLPHELQGSVVVGCIPGDLFNLRMSSNVSGGNHNVFYSRIYIRRLA